MVDRLNDLFGRAYLRVTSIDLRREEGQALTEYALVLALIVVGAVALMATIGGSVVGKFQAVCDAVAGEGACTSPPAG